VFILFYFESKSSQANIINQYALFPSQVKNILFSSNIILNKNVLMDFITYMFMHGSWLHLIGNCWFLWIFGDNVEGVMGHIGYLFFYLLFGVFACFIHIAITTTPNVPIIGASGAVAGVMGAYLILFPRATIITFVPFFLIWLLPIPAFVLLILWFIGQFLNGIINLTNSGKATSNIAFWAHIGGFIIGIIGGILYRGKKDRLYRYRSEY
jgi:membrane associated rhomboid family serine protease